MAYDLKIAGGEIVDGTGAARYRGDVGIRDGTDRRAGRCARQRAPHASTPAARSSRRASSTSTPTTTRRCFWDRMLTISPWHGVTTVVMGNCGFGIAPTRPEHRELILRTLENVEGMALDALEAGLGAEWPFETFPRVPRRDRARAARRSTSARWSGHTPRAALR